MASVTQINLELSKANFQSLEKKPPLRIEDYTETWMDTPDLRLLDAKMFLIRRIDFKTRKSSFSLKTYSKSSQDGATTLTVFQDEDVILSMVSQVLNQKLESLLSFACVCYIFLTKQQRFYRDNLWVELSKWKYNGNSGNYGVITFENLTLEDVKQLVPDYKVVQESFLVVLKESHTFCNRILSLLSAEVSSDLPYTAYEYDNFPYEDLFPDYGYGKISGSDDSSDGETCSDDESFGPDY